MSGDELNYVWCPSLDVCAWCNDSECDGIACIANLDADDPADHEAIERLHNWLRCGRVNEQVDAILADAEGRSVVPLTAELPARPSIEELLAGTEFDGLAPQPAPEPVDGRPRQSDDFLGVIGTDDCRPIPQIMAPQEAIHTAGALLFEAGATRGEATGVAGGDVTCSVDELMVWVDQARSVLSAIGIEVPGLPPHLEAHAAEVSARMLAVTHEPNEDQQPMPKSGQKPGGTS